MKKITAVLLLSCIIITTFACAGAATDISSVTFTYDRSIRNKGNRSYR